MEAVNKISEFLSRGSGAGYGSGSGAGSGSGYGAGYGAGSGYGSGSGAGSGSGYGAGYGAGSGSGYGSGYGSGRGSGDGVKSIGGHTVHMVDDVQTIIDHVRGNVAKGSILMGDLTTRKCYIVKGNNLFAHGTTLREARAALAEKLFDGMDEEERIAAFVAEHTLDKAYPNTDFFHWHNKLTGSCLLGREVFAEDHGVDMAGSMTVEEFVRLTQNAYGGEIIRKMWAALGGGAGG